VALAGAALGGQEAPVHRGRRGAQARPPHARGAEAVARAPEPSGGSGLGALASTRDEAARPTSRRAERHLDGANGSVRVTFLVRAPGRAEGVDVAQSRSMSGELLRCVTNELSGRMIGTPTTDAVGVSVTFRLRPTDAPATQSTQPGPTSQTSEPSQATQARATRL
jgi:hypothetical protein